MRLMRWGAVGLFFTSNLGVALAVQQVAQQPSADATAAVVKFEFTREGMSVPHFVLAIYEDGGGTYEADEAGRRSADLALQLVSRKHLDRKLTVSSATVGKVFKTARMLQLFNTECASKAKNIADSGTKTLSYSGASGTGSCTFNYSDNKSVTMLADIFLGMSYTLDVGRKLDFERRFDRLGLDAEMIDRKSVV